MFAVPGWSVSASKLTTQTAVPKNPITKQTIIPEVAAEDSKVVDRKRKRNGGKPGVAEVDSTNLSDLWEKVIEGKVKAKKDSKSKESSGEKRQKISGDKDVESAPSPTEEGEKPSHKSKKQKTLKQKKREKKAALLQSTGAALPNATANPPAPAAPAPAPKPAPQLTPLQASMRQKLISARFRHLNQTLYTTPSAHSLSLFSDNPEMFTEYHEGFRRQVEVWPENPVAGYIASIRARGHARRDNRGKAPAAEAAGEKPLPRTQGTCTIADLGCGDAGLATGLQPSLKKLNLQIHSFDLQSPSPLVTKADIAALPLPDASVDVAIFCLALMGTNWVDFIEEAYRVLAWKGELWVAEIKSRFGRPGKAGGRVEHSVGKRQKAQRDEASESKDLAVEVDGEAEAKQETDVAAFVEVLRKRGFVLQAEPDLTNRMFVKMLFVKGLTPVKGKCVPVPKGMEKLGLETWKKKPKGKFIEADDEAGPSSEASVLKPCVYKLR